jgi:tRNA uridine 5-carboxymethylaminomethyl modification enzyme
MFTSRAEHRLLLRIDNADLRLTPRGHEIGLVDNARWEAFSGRRDRYDRNVVVIERSLVRAPGGDRVPAAQLLRQPETRLASLVASGQLALDIDPVFSVNDVTSAETTIKYAGYLRRQQSEIERSRRDERRRIPSDFPFERVPGLSREMIQRLSQIRPDTLGHALRIPGVTPAAVAVVGAYLGRFQPSPAS